MGITSYTFQSPYSSPVQVGRVIPNSGTETTQQDNSALDSAVNQTANKASTFQATQVQEVEPAVTTTSDSKLLDTYA